MRLAQLQAWWLRMWTKKRKPATERLERASRQHRISDAQVRKAALDQVDRHAILLATVRATLDRLECKR
jgi:hypothetical protein